MRSIKEIFVIGHGPSSSHTMGPAKAAEYILNKYKIKDIAKIKVILFGSLASTGKGHLTDYIINLKFQNVPHEVSFDTINKVVHPNTMLFIIDTKDNKHYKEKIISIGGGTILVDDGSPTISQNDTYPHKYMSAILKYCEENKLHLADYIKKFEGNDITSYMENILKKMLETIQNGINKEGYLPGPLKIKRKAKWMYERLLEEKKHTEIKKKHYELIMTMSSLAVSEENASGGEVVTAPTCGSSGVIPACISYLKARGNDEKSIIDGLLVAGLIGMVCKTNATISGAEGGCQAEIGVAASMGAALIASAKGFDNKKIIQSAEIALEHSLGLTCDPVLGYVQVPCIERCVMYALKAKNAVTIAKLIPVETTIISFDDSVKTMFETGRDLESGYRETSTKGLARLIKENKTK